MHAGRACPVVRTRTDESKLCVSLLDSAPGAAPQPLPLRLQAGDEGRTRPSPRIRGDAPIGKDSLTARQLRAPWR